MAVCSHCGQEGRPHDLYCQYCGQQLDAEDGQSAEPEDLALGADAAPESGPLPAFEADVQEPSTAHAASAAPVAIAAPVARLLLRTLSPSGAVAEEREFLLDGRDIAVGRAPSCDIVLNGDPLASRRHALLRSRGRHYAVVDLGSSNGTYVNDLEIHEAAVLNDGDCITIGEHELIFSTGPASASASLPGASLGGPIPSVPLPETDPSVAALASEIQAQSQPQPAAPSAPASALESEPAAPSAPEAVPPQPYLGLAMSTNDLQALRAQLTQASEALARWVDEEARVAAQLRAALTEVRDHLSTLLDAHAPATSAEELIAIARQTADNPRHLDYITTLATHAAEIANALEAANGSDDLLSGLRALHARVEELLATTQSSAS